MSSPYVTEAGYNHPDLEAGDTGASGRRGFAAGMMQHLGGISAGETSYEAIAGSPLSPPGPSERRRLAMIFQDCALWPYVTALKTVMFPLRQMRLPGRGLRRWTSSTWWTRRGCRS